MDENKSCISINCGCCGGKSDTPNTPTGDRNPVGTVIAYMGTKAPQCYLICDGAEQKIADYPQLSKQIQEEFGTVNYFGGDGTATFAIPDLRNEFLRGYHGVSPYMLSGEVGKHQEATYIPTLVFYTDSGSLSFPGSNPPTTTILPVNEDQQDNILMGNMYTKMTVGVSDLAPNGFGRTFTSRPTNSAVLYCIKYEI